MSYLSEGCFAASAAWPKGARGGRGQESMIVSPAVAFFWSSETGALFRTGSASCSSLELYFILFEKRERDLRIGWPLFWIGL